MNIIVVGATGRMGKEIVQLCEAAKDIKLVATIDPDGKGSHKKIGGVKTNGKGVVIDFSSPEGLREALAWAQEKDWGFVSGTTGISEKENRLLKKASADIAVLWASNMSVGVAVVKSLLKNLSNLGEDFDYQIEDIHHKHKKDAPSGTAKTLQEELKKSVGKNVAPVVSIRGGGVFGIHTIWAMSDEEVIKIEHNALNRAVFAKGAVKAARFIATKKKGLFNFDNVVNDRA